MSDWQIPHGLASRVRDATYKDAWEREIERTVELRGILTDLIAELRDVSDNRALRLDLADWAEDRLREVQGG